MSIVPNFAPRFTPRLFTPDESSPESIAPAGLSPDMTLSEFVESYYIPIVMRGCSDTSVAEVRKTVDWWCKITKDPPLRLIDEYTIALFEDQIAATKYRRGKCGEERLLAAGTVDKHKRNLKAFLHRIGPNVVRARPSKAIVNEIPYVAIPTRKQWPKPHFAWTDVQKIFAAVDRMHLPNLPFISPGDFWRGYLGGLFAIGERSGTVWAIERPMFQLTEDRGWVLKLPDELVPKTDKGSPNGKRLASWYCEFVMRWPARTSRLFDCAHGRGWLGELHYRLQELASIKHPLPIQAWRRTHSAQMGLLGLAAGRQAAQQSLNHSSGETTSTFYVDIAEQVRPQLPCPWSGVARDGQQRLPFKFD